MSPQSETYMRLHERWEMEFAVKQTKPTAQITFKRTARILKETG